jgi:hypothetical protein
MAYIQKSAVDSNSSTATASVTFTNPVTAGSGLIAVISQSGTGAGRTYTVANGGVDTFTLAVSTSPSRAAHVYWCPVAVGGAITISATVNAGTAAFDLVAYEVPALDAGVTPVTSSFTGAGPTHYGADASGITTLTRSFVVTGTALASNVTGHTKHADFDGGNVGSGNSRYFQYWDALTAITNHRGGWTQTGTAVNGTSVIAAFAISADVAPPTSSGTGGRHAWFGR